MEQRFIRRKASVIMSFHRSPDLPVNAVNDKVLSVIESLSSQPDSPAPAVMVKCFVVSMTQKLGYTSFIAAALIHLQSLINDKAASVMRVALSQNLIHS
ncbi:hypothetical protein AVEN_231819-1 [Araneus ventricosus]|uniref:Uncharacterized protein n=1 Tax=Araneus ventricosus TaxID=182803 RepID=A0A4Y2WBP7_ARAVE|nr:hypothetical protein AVEN_231819-1 [Araneus ventricosus]